MRLSTGQFFMANIESSNRANSELFKVNQQLSSGKKILQPSDDPLGSAQALKLKRQIEQTNQNLDNIKVSDRRLKLEESVLMSVSDTIMSIQELAVKAGNGALSDTDRRILGSEVQERLEELAGLLNTQDAQGEYLFSGFKGLQRTYTLNEATGSYEFNGDSGQRFIQVSESKQIASTDSAVELFEDIEAITGITLTPASSGEISQAVVTDYEQWPTQLQDKGPYQLNFAAGGYSVTDAAGNTVTSATSYTSGDQVRFGGIALEIGSAADGDSFTIGGQAEKSSLLNTVKDLADALSSADSSSAANRLALDGVLSRTQAFMDSSLDSVLEVRGSIGSRLRQLETQENRLMDFRLFTQETLSDFEDLDYAEAASRFQLQKTALEAAYASFGKIQELNLFNFVR